MLKGKTKSGFDFEINEKRLKDWRLLRKIAAADENPLLTPELLDAILGQEQSKELENHLEDEDGIVDPELMSEDIASIFAAFSQLKNS